MPAPHRTPPDECGTSLEVLNHVDGAVTAQCVEGTSATYSAAVVTPDALPALVAALAAHLTVDARRALTRDLAARDGDAVVAVSDAWSAVIALGGIGSGATSARFRAAVEAARPTPTQDGES